MNRKKFGTNIGTSSILLIFVLLCLVSFAALSIVSANSDYQLSKKVLQRSTAYYTACNKAEESLSSLDLTLATLYDTKISKEEYFTQVGHTTSYLIPISDLQSLQVELDLLWPTTEKPQFYTIKSWQVIITGTLDYDETLSVIK